MLEGVGAALQHILLPSSIGFMVLGSIVGLVFGAIPGLGGTTALALLIPLTWGMDGFKAIAMMGGVMGSVAFGGSIAAILINTPGTPPNAATCFDGYPLARQGKAGMAIGAAACASSVGGVLGVVVLIAVMPLARSIVLLFGPPEFFMLAMFGLAAIALSAGGNMLRGLVTAGIGLTITYVGLDSLTGVERYTFGIDYLWDGVALIPAIIGMFAIAEMIQLTAEGGTIAREAGGDTSFRGVMEGVKAVFVHYPTLLRGSAIGALIGAVPGVGGTVASFLAYTATAQVSKDPDSFGKGNIQGVIAPESSNNAKDGGALIPTLAFGIPGSAEMAVFLGGLVLHGYQPGPLLIINHQDAVFAVILSLTFACIFASLLGVATARWLALFTRVNVQILAVGVPAIALIGAYAVRSNIYDVITAMAFGIVGYLMIRFHYPRLTFVIAVVLGRLVETSYKQSVIMGDGSLAIFVHRPMSLGLLVLLVLCLAFPTLRRALRGRRGARA